MGKAYLVIGSILALLAVLIGAFGAHALQPLLEANGKLEAYKTGVQYHMFHALAFLILGLLYQRNPHPLLRNVMILMLSGVLLFSGSLYVLALTGIGQLGIITPIGGFAFIMGWLLVIYYLIREY